MVKCTLCNEEFETDEVLQKHMRICIFCIDQKNIEKWHKQIRKKSYKKKFSNLT